MHTQRFLRILLAITVIALALRAFVCVQLYHAPDVLVPNGQTDMATYLRLGTEIRHGHWPDHFDYQPFYYAVFLPILYLFQTGSDAMWLVMGAQAILAAGAVYLIGLAAARLYGRRTALLAAAFLALSQVHIFFTPFLLFEVLNSFWIALLFYLLLRAWANNHWTQWLGVGLVLSAAALTRGNALLFLPIILLAILLRNRGTLRRGIGIFFAVIALFYLPQLPFSITNARYTGRWCGASTAGDKVLALGNTPEAPPGGLEYPMTYHAWCQDSDRHPSEGRISVPKHILSWFARNPLQVVELQFRKLLLFWDNAEIPNNISMERHGEFSSLLRWMLPSWVFTIPALAGLLFCWKKRNPRLLLLNSLIGMYCLSTVLFYILGRFRVGILPLLCILGAGFIHQIVQAWKYRRMPTPEKGSRRLVLMAAKTALAAFLACSAFPLYQLLYEAAVMKALTPDGVAVMLPHDTLLYDHGPLTVGGITFIQLPGNSDFTIDKKLIIPQARREMLRSHPFTMRLLMTGIQPETAPRVEFRHAGTTISPRIVTDRFHRWLEADFPSLAIEPDGGVLLTIHFPTQPSPPGMGIGFDRLREYGRTHCLGGGATLPYPFEASVELQARH